MFCDTETTGLDSQDQIIEISVCEQSGNELFYSRFKPGVPVHPGAAGVHGMCAASLESAPLWPEKVAQISVLMAGRPVIFFNSDFDTGMLYQTCRAFDLATDWLDELDTRCAMGLAASAFGATNRYGTISLANAAACAGVEWQGAAHGSTADTLATVDLVKHNPVIIA